jgi:dTDP-4-amino-4,6-dideoxygalactose transaminase
MREVKFAVQDIREEDLAAVREVLTSGWLIQGKYNRLFEEQFAALTGAPYAIAVSTCTAALHLSCMYAGIGPGDEVIVPAQTHVATAHAVELTGARAVIADVEPLSGIIQLDDAERRITARTKGLIVVHMAGYPAPSERIAAWCRERGLFLLEDCAHALGTTTEGRHVGITGHFGSFSFYPTKQIAIGEGGMLTCADEAAAHFARTRRAFGVDTPPEKRALPGVYDVQGLGNNYRMTDYQAAIGYHQLARYPLALAGRRANAERYRELLSDVGEIELPEPVDGHSYFLFQIFVKPPRSRDAVVQALGRAGIGCSIHYATPVPLMTYYRRKYGYREGDFPHAEDYGARNVSLPVHPFLTEADIHDVCETLKGCLRS